MMTPLLLILVCKQVLGAPFLFNLPESLANFASSASGNIADLTQEKTNTLDDDFFKDSTDPPLETNFLQSKIDKITQKFQFLARLASTPKQEEHISKEEFAGYNYEKPIKLTQHDSFNPSSIGIFFVELLGSLVGLLYGAAAQLNHQNPTTPSSL